MTYYNEEIFKLANKLYPDTISANHIIKAKQFMDSSMEGRIELKDISAAACLSKFYFIKQFKKYYGKTPHQYLTEKRTAYAKVLLELGHKVSDISFLIGFENISTFSASFKKETGLSPTEYKSNFS